MGNAFPKRFKYNPIEYAEFKTTTNGGSLKSFLFWKLSAELKMKPSSAFDAPIMYMVNMIQQLEVNQEDYHPALFEIFKDKEGVTIYARLLKFPA
jgi:hypothetical protein